MVYVFLADGFEIIEALAPVDMLTRAKIDVKTIGIGKKVITSSCGIAVTSDMTDEEFVFEDAQAIVLPGGMLGTLNLENSSCVQSVIDNAAKNNILICAICAAPSILGHKGLLNGKNAIAFPGFEDDLKGAHISDEYVVTDGNYITARGAGVAVDFGLEIVKRLRGEDIAGSVKSTIQCR